MGAFFTAVHVRSGQGPGLEKLVSALKADARKRGMEPCETGGDRQVVIVPPGPEGWVSIYDEATEGQDDESLDSLARLASRACGGAAVSVLVHDSDIVRLGLYEKGSPVDQFDSNPGYFGGPVSAEEKRASRGKPQRWRALLGGDEAVGRLKEVLGAEKLFAEATLGEVADLIGLPRSRAQTGFRYLKHASQEGWPEPRRLCFRALERPAWETRAEGPPALEVRSFGAVPIELAVGDELRLPVTSNNRGGASTGLDVVAFGPGLSLVEIERFELLLGSPRNSTHRVLEARSALAEGSAPLRMVSVGDAALPAGVAEADGAMLAMPAGDVRKMMEAMSAGQVHVNAVGKVTSPGEGELHVGLVPHGNRAGQTSLTFHLRVAAPLFRPLRSPAGTASHLLRPLTEGEKLFAMVMYRAHDQAAIEHAERALGALLEKRGEGELSYSIGHADFSKRPKTGKAKGKGFFDGKTGRAVREAMRRERVVDVATDPAGGAFAAMMALAGAPRSPGFGFTFGSTLMPHEGVDLLHGLGLWADLDGCSAQEREAFEGLFGRLVDEAMASGALQAAMGLGGFGPHTGPEHTAYESACGIESGVVTCSRAWCTRYLRMTGNRATWLGPSLASRLEGEPPPGVVSARVGEALRLGFARPSEAAWHELEVWLAPLLPHGSEASEAVRAYYDRLRG